MKGGRAGASSAFHVASLRLVKNSVWNMVALFATICVHFVTVPVVISRIGLPQFGIAGLVLAVWAPLLLIGTVVGQAVTRELGGQALEHDEAGARRVVQSASYVWVLSTLFGGALLLLVGPALLRLLTRRRCRRVWPVQIAVGIDRRARGGDRSAIARR